MKFHATVIPILFSAYGIFFLTSCAREQPHSAQNSSPTHEHPSLDNLDPDFLSMLSPSTIRYRGRVYGLLGLKEDEHSSQEVAKTVFERFMVDADKLRYEVWNNNDIPLDNKNVPLIWLVCFGSHLRILNQDMLVAGGASLCEQHFGSCNMMIQAKDGMKQLNWEQLLKDSAKDRRDYAPLDYTIEEQ